MMPWFVAGMLGLGPRPSAQPAAAGTGTARPRVGIFMGLAGDAARSERYAETVGALVRVLDSVYGIGRDRIDVLFGQGEIPDFPPCTRENLERACAQLRAARRANVPTWTFVLGHANSNKRDVFLNLPGPDVRAREFGAWLDAARGAAPGILVLTTAASGRIAAHIGRRGLVLLAATQPEAEDNETLFPHLLPAVLADPGTDADADGYVDALELYRQISTHVRALYEKQGLLQTEDALLDGDGNGEWLRQPTAADVRGARAARLKTRVTP